MTVRPHRHARVAVAVALLCATGVAGAIALRAPHSDAADGSETTAEDASLATAKVERRDLVDRVSVSGTLGYGETASVRNHRPGTLTSMSQPGVTLERGSVAYTVDGRPVPLLYGSIPMWRRLDNGVEGVDVAQLEENLVALGYADEGQLKMDGKYDARTAAAVKRWQKELQVDQTGFVDLGDLQYVEDPVRVAKHVAAVGDQVGPGAVVLEVTGTARQVTISLEAKRRSLVNEGDAVTVDLPDGSSTPGTISEVGRVAAAEETGIPGDSGTAKISVVVTLDDPAAAGELDATPVVVQLTRSTATGVLAVPVRALLALAEGGYALDIVHAGGRALVGVQLGAFADGWVEVTGELREGETVVVAP